MLHYAREHNLGKIVIGRQGERRWWERAGFADRLARRAPDLDLVVIALDEKPASLPARANDNRTALDKWRQQLKGCLLAVALCAIITVVAMQWLMAFEAANLVMLYLLGVVIIALLYGRWPSVLATFINVISFDLFFRRPTRHAGGFRRPVSADVRRDADRWSGDRQPDRRDALPGAGGALPRAAHPPPV